MRLASTTAVLLLLAGAAAAQSAHAPVTLASEKDLGAWQVVVAPAETITDVVSVRPDGVIAVTGTPIGYIATRISLKNYRIHAEWRWPGKPGNGGVLVHISSGPKDRQWPVSYQVQMKNTAVGDLLPMAGATFGEALSTPPDAKTPQLNHAAPDSERPVGEWNTCDVTCLDDTIEVVINGVVQNRVTRCALTSGLVGFQLEGTPFELRHVAITPLRRPAPSTSSSLGPSALQESVSGR